MTTTTDDITPRLIAVEDAVAEVRAEQRQTNSRIGALTERVAAMEGRLYTLESDIREVRAEQQAIGVRLNAMSERMATMEGRLTRIETEMVEMRADFREMRERMDRMHQENNERHQGTNSRIDRVFWAVIGAGTVVGGGIIASLLTIAFRTAT